MIILFRDTSCIGYYNKFAMYGRLCILLCGAKWDNRCRFACRAINELLLYHVRQQTGTHLYTGNLSLGYNHHRSFPGTEAL